MDITRLTTPVVIVGGVATALYMPERTTLGLDILVELAALGKLELGQS